VNYPADLNNRIIFREDFLHGIAAWNIETDSDSTIFKPENGTLEISAPKGLTLWYSKILEGNIKISYEAFIIKDDGVNDRASDLNCFWMANDPLYPDDLSERSKWRNGVFEKYYSLTLYYAGYGGNNNTTTRFRKYNGDYESFKEKKIQPDIIKEYSDPLHLIIPNRWNKIEITVNGNITSYIFNSEILFYYVDPCPYKKGYFGIRTVTNHMLIKNVEITRL
jgi:rhamnogalacturonan endolyase